MPLRQLDDFICVECAEPLTEDGDTGMIGCTNTDCPRCGGFDPGSYDNAVRGVPEQHRGGFA
jgi:hypothetical protein